MNYTFNEYQEKTGETAIYPGKGETLGLLYVGLGLGESGEVQGKLKKVIRDHEGVVTEESRAAITKELGDTLWYVAQTASELGISLEDIAQQNISKLLDRKERGVLKGSGDNR